VYAPDVVGGSQYVKRILVTLALAGCFLTGCGGQGVKLNDISYLANICQVEVVGPPMLWAIWTIKPSEAVTIDHVSLSPARQPKVEIVKALAETRNAGGIAGSASSQRSTFG
jgi:hypothetical protein